MTSPARAGPTARDRLTLTRSTLDAARSCVLGTSSGMIDPQAGCCTAMPAPRANVKASSKAAGICPAAVRTASRTPTIKK